MRDQVDKILDDVLEICQRVGLDAQSMMFSMALDKRVLASHHNSPSAVRLLRAIQAVLMKPRVDQDELAEVYGALLEMLVCNFGSEHARQLMAGFREIVLARSALKVNDRDGNPVEYIVDGERREVVEKSGDVPVVSQTEIDQLAMLHAFESAVKH